MGTAGPKSCTMVHLNYVCLSICVQVYAGRRAQFLVSHLDQLSPFITPAVVAQLKACAAKGPQQWRCPDPPAEQPEQIKAVLRDYQVPMNNMRTALMHVTSHMMGLIHCCHKEYFPSDVSPTEQCFISTI